MEVKVGGLIPNLIRALKEKRKKKNAPPEKPQSDIIVDEIDEQRAQPYEGYRFTVGYNDDRNEEQILQPTYSVVCEFFDKMSDGLLQFVILENSKSIGLSFWQGYRMSWSISPQPSSNSVLICISI